VDEYVPMTVPDRATFELVKTAEQMVEDDDVEVEVDVVDVTLPETSLKIMK
jgi:hypothetical protein